MVRCTEANMGYFKLLSHHFPTDKESKPLKMPVTQLRFKPVVLKHDSGKLSLN
jgi:hypothetical protein